MVDLEAIEALGCVRCWAIIWTRAVARHATDRVARDLMALVAQARIGTRSH